jgi:phosphoribosyl 1,2-cyclic phosphodiesterase
VGADTVVGAGCTGRRGRRSTVSVSFHGVRGSTPCSGPEVARYGGNTSCVSLAVADGPPIVFDLGTGLRNFGAGVPSHTPFLGAALVTHLHWDHVQGLPFFTPTLRPGGHLDVFGPRQPDGGLRDAFERMVQPPFFPVTFDDFAGSFEFGDVHDDDFALFDAKVTARPVPHLGATVGYRVERGGVTVAYVSDHQQPLDGSFRVADAVLELAEGCDLLIHDAQYTACDFAHKAHWGHCTVEYAVEVARQAGARRLALFHHDPAHGDDLLDTIHGAARVAGNHWGIDVIGACEGMSIVL